MNPAESSLEKPLRLLVVDDDVVDRAAVRRALRAGGVPSEVEEAEDVEAALAALADPTQPFDCVFLDYNLPGGDSRHVLRQVRESSPSTPVIVLTGQQDAQTAAALIKQGAADYLSKGALTPERLVRSLRQAVRLHRAETQTRKAEREREQALAARSRFYAVMSHELRTPVNAILGYNDLVLAGVYGEIPEAARQSIERSQRATRHLLELVNDVLDLSKLEAGKTEIVPSPVVLPDLLEELLATVRPLAESRESPLLVQVHGCDEPIVTDPRRVRQILLNLVSNAIKFGAGAPVSIDCRRDAEGWVEVAVSDQGPGIPPEDLSRIFEEFVQLPNTAEGGTGLGLPISRRLAGLLGGELGVESRSGEGSVFRLRLPAVAGAVPVG